MFAACMSVVTPCTADAQLGGLIKKKVKEAIKPPEKPSEPAPAPAGKSTNGAAKDGGGAGLPAIQNGVLMISSETIARVTRGLDSETVMLADFHKVLAKYPTREQYEQCKQKVIMSPEGQKIALRMANAPQNMTPEQSRALITQMNLDVEALQKKACPLDPNDWTDYKRSERIKQIHEKAASGGGLSEYEYSILVERLVFYCETRKQMDMSPDKGDMKIPGSGAGMYWIFKKEELAALKQLNCDAFMKKYASVYGT